MCLLNSTYVDDIVMDADTEEAAFELYTQSKDIFCRGGFNLQKFVSNSQELQQRIDCAEGVTHSFHELEESFAQATLGTTPNVSIREYKIFRSFMESH